MVPLEVSPEDPKSCVIPEKLKKGLGVRGLRYRGLGFWGLVSNQPSVGKPKPCKGVVL